MPRQTSSNVGEILDKAATRGITPEELDILVTKTRELRAARERELNTIQELLAELEKRQLKSR